MFRADALAATAISAALVACGGATTESPVVTVPVIASSPAPTIIASPLEPPKPLSLLPEGAHFYVSIEQDGREIIADDARVDIVHRPFAVVVRFAHPGAIMLNVSEWSRNFLLAGAGNHKELEGFVGQGHGMAEPAPPERQLYIAEDASHYVFYTNDLAHRCHEVRHEGSVVACIRFVDALTSVATKRSIDVRQPSANGFYLVAVMFDPAKPDVELQRERLRIAFDS